MSGAADNISISGLEGQARNRSKVVRPVANRVSGMTKPFGVAAPLETKKRRGNVTFL